jgi:predicted transcriptional regulator
MFVQPLGLLATRMVSRIKKGLDQLDRGEFVSHEEVGTRLNQMFRT